MKSMLWLLIGVGSTIGGFLPVLFHASYFSAWGILGTLIGAAAGVYFYRRLDL